MRQCPLCATPYDDGVEFCPLDGRVLLAADDLLGRTVGGKYRVESIIGTGGQGTVYRAQHVQLERAVALKVVRGGRVEREQMVDRFLREARAVARLRHPYIVTIHDFDVDPEIGAYIVMELLEGRSLFAELRNRSRLPVDVALEFMRQICSGVHAAHVEGLVHRDLKPENVFIETRADGTPSLKILDFGVAKMRRLMAGENAGDDPDGPSPTNAGMVMGTPAYMAPEQCRARPLDARADVYALGCILFEMIAGQPPFGRGEPVDLLFKQCYDPPPAVTEFDPSAPAAIDVVLRKALAKRPEERFQSADEMRQALNEIWVPPSTDNASARAEPAASVESTGSPTYFGETFAAGVERGNLPATVNAFVGRESEIGAIRRLLESNRLITLTGPTGCGKTRLSLQVAAEVASKYRDGVWVVELATLSDPALVAQALASVLGIREVAGKPLADQLREALAPKRLLLVLDNCEHLLGACATAVASLLRGCPNVRLLATSQQPLGVAGEVTWSVPMLAVPEGDAAVDVDAALASEAVRLFVERATASNPGFELTPANVGHVAAICRQLDGHPLALELAAARVRMLPVDQIAARLEDRFRLLTTGDRTAQPRQRTLQAAMDWSYDLLDEPERLAFMRLSVFSGGFTLDAAEEVCAADDLSSYAVLDALGLLVDKSLVTLTHRGAEARYSMLSTIRYYGALKLQQSGDAALVRSRHRDHFLELAERAGSRLRGPELAEWLDRLEAEHDNFRAALEWCQAGARESDALIRLACALDIFWEIRGHAREGFVWLERALAHRGSADDETVARALHGAGNLARLQGRHSDAHRLLEESLGIRRRLGDLVMVANTLNHLGFVAQRVGDYTRAVALHAEGLEIARAAGDDWAAASSLNNLGVIARFRGEPGEAVERFKESLELFREIGDDREVANALTNLAVLAAMGGDLDAGERLLMEGLELRRALADPLGIANSLVNLGEISQLKRDFGRAVAYLGESISLHMKLDDLRGVAFALEAFLTVAAGAGEPAVALQLAGAAATLRRRIGAPLSPPEQADLDAHVAVARRAFPAARAEELIAAGRTTQLRKAIDLARGIRPGRGVAPESETART